MQKEFEERKVNMNELFEKKRDKKRERRKKRDNKKKMVKKLSKLAQGVNKYEGINGNFVEVFQKEVEENPDILHKTEENQKCNFEEFDYNVEAPKEMKKIIRNNDVKIEDDGSVIDKDKEKLDENFEEDLEEEYEEGDSIIEDEIEFSKIEEKAKAEIKIEEQIKVKEMPKNLFIFDNDL